MLKYLNEEQNKLLRYHKSRKSLSSNTLNDLIIRTLKSNSILSYSDLGSNIAVYQDVQNEILKDLEELKLKDKAGYDMLREYLTRESLREKILSHFPTVEYELSYKSVNKSEGFFAAAINGVTDEEMESVIDLIRKIDDLFTLLPPSRPHGCFIYSPEMPPLSAQREIALRFEQPQYYGLAISFAAEEKINEIMKLMDGRHVEILENYKIASYVTNPIGIGFREDEHFPEHDVMTINKSGQMYFLFFV